MGALTLAIAIAGFFFGVASLVLSLYNTIRIHSPAPATQMQYSPIQTMNQAQNLFHAQLQDPSPLEDNLGMPEVYDAEEEDLDDFDRYRL